MMPLRMNCPKLLITGASLASLALFAAPAAAEGDETEIDEIIMYGVDSDTNELLRYAFETDVYEPIAQLYDQFEDPLVDVEAIGYIPEGEYKGMYCCPTKGNSEGHLAKIDLMTGTCTVNYDHVISPDGLIGLVAHEKTDGSGDWELLAATKYTEELLSIDPATGVATKLFDVTHHFEGLAMNSEGVLFGATRRNLYVIDLDTEAQTKVASHGFDKVESLEFAFGDAQPSIDVPGVDSSWTEFGVLFAFDDRSDTLAVLNPNTAQGVPYDCSFATVDCEGIIIFTKMTDPLGFVQVSAFD